MNIDNFKNKLIAVLGFGQEGKAVTHFLLKKGFSPVIFDFKELKDFSRDEQEEIKKLNVNFIFGKDSLKELTGFDLAFRSPGVWRLHPDLIKAEKNGLVITSQTEFFLEHCVGKVIGVTGTKGKGTTSTLIYKTLKTAKDKNLFYKDKLLKNSSRIFLTGNIGKVNPLKILQSIRPTDIVVFELSSFQLQDLKISPHIAVVLMVTSDHLDVHKNLTEYHKAKQSISKYQNKNDKTIVNADYSVSLKIAQSGKGQKYFFSTKTNNKNLSGQIVNNNITLSVNNKIQKFNTSLVKLKGIHNLENILAASIVSSICGVKLEAIKLTLSKFLGLEHRLKLVAKRGEISFYDDSFSTNPETTIAAIKSFTEPVVLILGGHEKNLDFVNLVKLLAKTKNLKSVILIGDTSANLFKLLTKHRYPGQIFKGAKNMEQIFSQIKKTCIKKGIILLSPGSSSFGLFKNYKERGEQFTKFAKLWHTK